jgi:hypothetical protein|nr:MAG TPA: hypothetical protein [Inoviridae sp.]
MELIKSQFAVTYEIKDGDIKATSAGVMDGRPYGASVRVSCVNTFEVLNEKTQFTNTVKQEVFFKIPCPDDLTAGNVGRFFLQKFKNHETVICMGGLPDRNNVITLINPVEYFLPETATTKKVSIAPKA